MNTVDATRVPPQCPLNAANTLEGMWVPGVSKGLHCGQPAPRILSHRWQIPAAQPWPPFPGTRHTEAR